MKLLITFDGEDPQQPPDVPIDEWLGSFVFHAIPDDFDGSDAEAFTPGWFVILPLGSLKRDSVPQEGHTAFDFGALRELRKIGGGRY